MAFCFQAPCKVWRTSSSNSARKRRSPPGDQMAFLHFLEAVGWRGWLDYFIGSWTSFGFPRETAEISPPFPSAARPHAAIFSTPLLHTARASAPASRLFTRPLSPSPCPSVRALYVFHPLISLAGHWFGFAIPSLSLGGASVVAEENRYPFYVFIISQIKKLMN